MHDPDTLLFTVGPFSIWHHDPCRDGSDDSCGHFKRARHGSPEVLEKIYRDILFDWNCHYQPLFSTSGDPQLSTIGIVLNFFFHAAARHFGDSRAKAIKFIQKNLAEILIFAENPVDSMAPGIQGRFGEDKEPKEDRARRAASCVYGWILRRLQRWWQKPLFHLHHWRITCRWFRRA